MQFSKILLATLFAIPLSSAQQVADGLIVPFTSALPACASLCGPLFDVQGKCTPPNIATIDTSCFCSDSRLAAFGNDGTTGVSSVCGTTSCTSATDLQKVKSWYQSFCANKATPSTTTNAAGTATGTSKSTSGSSSGNNSGSTDDDDSRSWFQSHTKWVIMIIIVVVGIVTIWIAAWLLRRRYLRRKEKEFEMRPPVSWGPHQTQEASGGFGDGVVEGRGKGPAGAGGHHKEAGALATPANGTRLKKEKMGWFKSNVS